jgi:hypothetical protein
VKPSKGMEKFSNAKRLQVQKQFWLRSSGLRCEKLSKDVSIIVSMMMGGNEGVSEQN